ncbi:DinB family protein [Amycolatopsis sp. NPDC059027]|uniref:DinB family protein n=1 Tax=Amycolatopsis sp. NPDC059027 TaxID=3346709 RepID=UPI00366BD0AD
MSIDWPAHLAEQLDWHWHNHLRPKLATLTDDEYFWEPVDGCWTVRPRRDDDVDAPGGGSHVIDWAFPAPEPPPVTTIAWRLAHVIVGVLGMRAASHFGGPPMDYGTFPYATTAAEALSQLDDAYASWIGGVRGLDADGLAEPCGPAEGAYAEEPMATLVLHIHRETIHHGAEILLLRDLYRNRHTSHFSPS